MVDKAKLFKAFRIPTEDGVSLHAKAMFPKPTVEPRRVMFISPLVGAGAVQSLLIYRNFTRRGSILLSFEYRGHAQSTGTFEFDKAVPGTPGSSGSSSGSSGDAILNSARMPLMACLEVRGRANQILCSDNYVVVSTIKCSAF
jgi:hypothetical protein